MEGKLSFHLKTFTHFPVNIAILLFISLKAFSKEFPMFTKFYVII